MLGDCCKCDMLRPGPDGGGDPKPVAIGGDMPNCVGDATPPPGDTRPCLNPPRDCICICCTASLPASANWLCTSTACCRRLLSYIRGGSSDLGELSRESDWC